MLMDVTALCAFDFVAVRCAVNACNSMRVHLTQQYSALHMGSIFRDVGVVLPAASGCVW